jgi:hypothetical protein
MDECASTFSIEAISFGDFREKKFICRAIHRKSTGYSHFFHIPNMNELPGCLAKPRLWLHPSNVPMAAVRVFLRGD